MARKTKYDVKTVLDSTGPLLTTELAETIAKIYKVGTAAAVKGVERAFAKGIVKRVEFMTFGRREHVYFSRSTSSCLVKKALEVIQHRRPIVYRIYRALQKERILRFWDVAKITGLPKFRFHNKESYFDVIQHLTDLGVALTNSISLREDTIDFLFLRTRPAVKTRDLRRYATMMKSRQILIESYLAGLERVKMIHKIELNKSINHRMFDAVGEAVSPRPMLVVFDFNLMRMTEDYDIDGLLDRVYALRRQYSKRVIITYCVSRGFTKSAQRKAVTGRFKQINLIRVSEEKGRLRTERIDGISRDSRGQFFESQIEYVLKKSGYRRIQRGLEVYRSGQTLTEKTTSERFTDIDIIMQSKDESKVIICELKNWYNPVKQETVAEWVQVKLNPIVDYLQSRLALKKKIEAWFIVSRKSRNIDESEIGRIARCAIRVLTKRELIDDIVSKIDRHLANELKPIVLY